MQVQTENAERFQGRTASQDVLALSACSTPFAELFALDLATSVADNPASYGLYPDTGARCGHTYTYADDPSIGKFAIVETSQVLDAGNDVLAWYIRDFERLFIISDARVWSLYGEAMERYIRRADGKALTYVLPSKANNERNKSMRNFVRITNWLNQHRATKRDVVIAFGGGVTTDLAGFVASTFRRGLRRINLPTTLTSMTDAALSCKTGVNVCAVKNAVGTTQAPCAVIIDPAFIATCARRDLRAGLAEVAKLAVIRSPALFHFLEQHGGSLLKRRSMTEADCQATSFAARLFLRMKWEHPFPGNQPASLRSFGHSFSRQIEAASGFTLVHGLAVAIEMCVATELSSLLGTLNASDRDRIRSLLWTLGLPSHCPQCHIDNIWPVFSDRSEQRRPFYFPAPIRIGKGVFLDQFSRDQLAIAIQRAAQ